MLGEVIAGRYNIVQHDARDAASLVEVGSSRGVPARLCRAYVDAGLRIVTGFVEPHLFAGFSGGAKGVMPGVAGAEIVMSNHGGPQLAHPRARWLQGPSNPVFEEMQAGCDLCPPGFLLNVTLDSDKRITGVFSGDWREAHAAAIEQARRQYAAPISRPFDVVLVTNMGYPADLNLYQSIKGVSVAAEGVRQGGAIVLVAGCEDGAGSDDYVGMLAEGESPAALLQTILSERTPRLDQWQIQLQAMAQARARILVHSTLPPAAVRAAHMEVAEDVGQTVTRLVEEARGEGREGSVLVLPWGQLTVPVLA
jgi:nickel-dependent lactate racemase